jgi:ribosomal protein S1
MDLKIHDFVMAEITDVSDSGLQLNYKNMKGMVSLKDMDWMASGALERMYSNYKVGNIIEVVIVDVKENRFIASRKDVFPELNPWRNPKLYQVGKAFSSVVKAITHAGYLVELSAGALALIKDCNAHINYQVGQLLNVRIIDVNPDVKKIIAVPMA